eukprot:g6705.t1
MWVGYNEANRLGVECVLIDRRRSITGARLNVLCPGGQSVSDMLDHEFEFYVEKCWLALEAACKLFAKETLLVVAPLRTPGGEAQMWQLTYINSMEARPASGFGSAPAGAAPLMVVPIPNPTGMQELDFTLFEVGADRAQALRRSADALGREYTPPAAAAAFGSRTVDAFGGAGNVQQSALAVQSVGAYRISIAPTLADLQTRAPWNRFSIPPAHVGPILAAMARDYGQGYAFAVAEGDPAKPRIEQAGFSVVYRDASPFGAFFPTAHEPQPAGSAVGNVEVAQMDVTCVAMGCVIHQGSAPDAAGLQRRARDQQAQQAQQAPQLDPLRFDRPLHAGADVRPAGHVVLRADDGACAALSLLQASGMAGTGFSFGGSSAGFGGFGGSSAGAAPPTDRVDTSWAAGLNRWRAATELLAALPRRGAAGTAHQGTVLAHGTPRVATIWTLQGPHANANVRARLATAADAEATEGLLADVAEWLDARALGTGAAARQGLGQRAGAKLDLGLALLARQLAQPGYVDRYSDHGGGPCAAPGGAYLNLDIANCDLDAAGFALKDGAARTLALGPVDGLFSPPPGAAPAAPPAPRDTLGSTYLHICAVRAPWRSVEARTVGGAAAAAVAMPAIHSMAALPRSQPTCAPGAFG